MDDDLKELLKKIDERLDRQEKITQQRLDELEDRLDVMDQRLERIEAAVNVLINKAPLH